MVRGVKNQVSARKFIADNMWLTARIMGLSQAGIRICLDCIVRALVPSNGVAGTYQLIIFKKIVCALKKRFSELLKPPVQRYL
jgi:hypothetical protein